MIIVIEYKNGRTREIDPTTFTTPQAIVRDSKSAKNVATDFDLRVDKLDTEGLRLDIYWYDAGTSIAEVPVEGVHTEKGGDLHLPRPARRMGASLLLLNPVGLKSVSRILVNRGGEQATVAWRQGDGNWLIIGSKFEAQRIQTYTDATTTSANAQAVKVFRYIQHANPLMPPEKICDIMGYPLKAMEYIFKSELAQIDDERQAQDGNTDIDTVPFGLDAASDTGENTHADLASEGDTGNDTLLGHGRLSPDPHENMGIGRRSRVPSYREEYIRDRLKRRHAPQDAGEDGDGYGIDSRGSDDDEGRDLMRDLLSRFDDDDMFEDE